MSGTETPKTGPIVGDDNPDERCWLTPEFHVLRKRFEFWKRRLQSLEIRFQSRTVIPAALNCSGRTLQRIAVFLEQQFAIFFESQRPPIDPETLRRLLIHAEQTARQCEARFDAMDAAEFAIGAMIDVLHELLLRPCADGKPLTEIADRLQGTADNHRDCWTFLDPGFASITAEKYQAGQMRRIPTRSRETVPEILHTGIACAQIAAQLVGSLKLSPESRRAVLTGCLLQDIGFLLLERRFRCSPSELRRLEPDEFARHPRFGAALAEGIAGLSVDVLRAIGRHHLRRSNPARNESPEVADIVAVVSRFHELQTDASKAGNHDTAITIALQSLESETLLGDWHGDVSRALVTALQHCITPVPWPFDKNGETLPAPHFLTTTPQPAAAVSSGRRLM